MDNIKKASDGLEAKRAYMPPVVVEGGVEMNEGDDDVKSQDISDDEASLEPRDVGCCEKFFSCMKISILIVLILYLWINSSVRRQE